MHTREAMGLAIVAFSLGACTGTTPEVFIEDGAAMLEEDEVAMYAADAGVSREVAERMLHEQGVLLAFADSMRSRPGYAGFMVVTEGETVSGVLAVTEPSLFEVPAGLAVKVMSARVSEADFRAIQGSVAQSLIDAGHTDVLAVTYDPFSDELIVWRSNRTSLGGEASAAFVAQVRQILGSDFADVVVRTEAPPPVEF
jgi:hypothetical protein